MTKDEQREAMGQYYPGLVKLFRTKGFPLEESRELAQVTFFRVLKNWKSYRGESLWGYLVQTALSVWKNEIRRRTTERRYVLETADETLDALQQATQMGRAPISPERAALEKEAKEEQEMWLHRLQAAMLTLTEGQREALLLYLQGMKGREIAPLLGVSHAAVRTRISQAKQRLREALGTRKGGPE